MKIIAKIKIIKQISELIEKEQTGTSTEFAKRVNISRTSMYQLFEEIESMGVSIKYDKRKRSYYYDGSKKIRVVDPIQIVETGN
ncbi:HTH domain-containing protein [Carboxylicivirga linearis]|uniref:HTH domain-containing protein n=1 Tax=Carboxylicivirga linearis TaxID=1628157 RepID=A0ABS5JRE6_9BACT|nr:HTH domain-containing protein [Carboxylicivirga linearis]MBS2097444.1 HTH domain-containing protein [Carboxylicivirga linearis]